MAERGGLSPMMRQYREMKAKYPDYILMYRLGDFYEMFFEDAITASRELDITLTGRDCGMEERAPMCGVPYHSVDGYIARLVAKGFKVSVCEQIKAEGTNDVVGREVTRIITPGTVTDPEMLDETNNNFIVALFAEQGKVALCAVDVSTGDIFLNDAVSVKDPVTETDLGKYQPREIYVNEESSKLPVVSAYLQRHEGCLLTRASVCEKAEEEVSGQLGLPFEQTGLESGALTTKTLGSLFHYLHETQLCSLSHIRNLTRVGAYTQMELDLSTWRSLEIVETMRTAEKKGSLLGVLDHTRTAMGARLLRQFLLRPLLDPLQIARRQDAVEDLFHDNILRANLKEELSSIKDVERLLTKVVYGTINPHEVRNLAVSFEPLPRIRQLLSAATLRSPYLKELTRNLDDLHDLTGHINERLCDDPPLSARDGKIIRSGFSSDVDELRLMLTDSKKILANLEAREKEETGISKLKIGYNKVFGYYLEVSNAFKDKVPETYIRKQTLVNGERFITPELKEIEAKLLSASDRVVELEARLFEELRSYLSENLERIKTTASVLSFLDVFASLAEVAVKHSYVRPVVNTSDVLDIKNGRHPVVEQMLRNDLFVPNDAYLNGADYRMAILTGPNMAGKSTYMRSVALIVLLAQIGSFVPATSASIGVVDKIFTRIGASDDLGAGQSTFMLEMTEVANILKNATKKSLLIFDEIGRGTSTFDGMSIARAVLEYVAEKIKARSMFATHYHELIALEKTVPGVKNYNVAAKKRGNTVIFLRKIVPGGTDDSYGIDVARLAGVPDEVIRNAEKILTELEACRVPSTPVCTRPDEDAQISLTSSVADEILAELKTTDASVLTPIEAMNLLYNLSQKAREI